MTIPQPRLTFMAVALLMAFTAGEAAAQVRSPQFGRPPNRRPVTSPYLNLLRGGGIGFNYFRRVRPEQEFRNADNALTRSLNNVRNQLNRQTQQPGQQPGGALGITGHPVRFLDLGGYFSGGVGGAGSGNISTTTGPGSLGGNRRTTRRTTAGPASLGSRSGSLRR